VGAVDRINDPAFSLIASTNLFHEPLSMTVSLSTLEVIIREAGDIALSYFNDLQNLEISQKSPRDFVTAADVSVEKFLQAELGKHYPEYGFWGEESGQSNYVCILLTCYG
jgi:fructose-1,6-bisphosphatase/inositol monophosphatase family enzyme